jgi:predicted metal-binding protein
MPESFVAKDAHHKCEFGCWFYSNKDSGFHELPAFIEIGDSHKTMHESAREICLKMKVNGLVQSEDYDYFVRNLTSFREALADFRQRVIATLENVSN